MVMVAYLFGFASGDLFACLLLPVGLGCLLVIDWCRCLGCHWGCLFVLLLGCWFAVCSDCLFILRS